MADNALVTPLAFSVPRAIDKRGRDQDQLSPQSIPVTVVRVVGEFVTVKAEVTSPFTIPEITIPQAFSSSIRPETKVGSRGFAVSADYYLGGQSGLGGGSANLYNRGNLTNLVFVPISQKSFTSRNLNQAYIEGSEGVVIQNEAGTTKVTINPDGTITITAPGAGLTVNGNLVVNGSITGGGGSGDEMTLTGNVNVIGEVTANGVPLSTHIHGGVTTGGGDTGIPIP